MFFSVSNQSKSNLNFTIEYLDRIFDKSEIYLVCNSIDTDLLVKDYSVNILNNLDDLIKVSNKYEEVYFTLGIHPHESSEMNETIIKKIYENANNTKFIGIGETGLDFFYNYSDKKSQIQSFEKHIEISQNLSLPLIVHMRDAEQDILRIIKHKIKSKNFNGVIHCFTGTQKFADEIIELGFYISASGLTVCRSLVLL